MTFTYADRNPKTILHSWGRFKARIYEAVVVGDLLALRGDEADDALQLACAGDPYYAMAIACQKGDADATITCALAAELKAPVSIATGGIATQAYFGDDTDYVGSAIYLSDTAGEVASSAPSNVQQVGYYIARDRIVVVPGHMLTGTTFSFSGAGTFGGTLGLSGVLTNSALINADGGIAVDTDKFTVAVTGDTVIKAGGLNITAGGLILGTGANRLGLGAAEAVTISGGVATITKPFVDLTGEGTTTDALDTITYTSCAEGDLLILSTSRSDTLTVNDTNIDLGASTRTIAAAGTYLVLIYNGTQWGELCYLAGDNV